jgi:hypothetical protein
MVLWFVKCCVHSHVSGTNHNQDSESVLWTRYQIKYDSAFQLPMSVYNHIIVFLD